MQLWIVNDPGLATTYPLLTYSLVNPLINKPTLSPLSPLSNYFLNVSIPVIDVLTGLLLYPINSTSSPTFTIPVSTVPVTTVPLPYEYFN